MTLSQVEHHQHSLQQMKWGVTRCLEYTKSVRDLSQTIGQDALTLIKVVQEEHKSYARSMGTLAEGLSRNTHRSRRLQKESWGP